jgi:iron(III) transport system substrate-binding protein
MRKISFRLFILAAILVIVAPAWSATPPGTSAPTTPSPSKAPVAGIATTQPPGMQAALDRLYGASKKEGQVRFQGSAPVELIDSMVKVIAKRYPGIKVTYTNKSGGETATQIITEAPSGRVSIDAAGVPLNGSGGLIERDLVIATKEWEQLGVPPEFILINNRYMMWFDVPSIIAYNTNQLSPSDVPRSWDDLINPRWKGGKLILDARVHFLDSLILDPAWGEQKILKLATSLKAQEPLFVPRMVLALDQLAAGQAPLASVSMQNFLKMRDAGAPIAATAISPIVANSLGLVVVKGTPYPNAAKLWIAWLMTSEARKLLDELGYFGLAKPCKASRQAQLLCDNNIRVVTEETLERAALIEQFRPKIEEAIGSRQ